MDNVMKRYGDSEAIAREYFDSLTIEFRMIDAVNANTEYELFGETFKTPVMSAALSRLDQVREGGAVDTARGVKNAGAVMWTGIGSEEELEAQINTGAKVIKIIKPYADIDLIYRKIEHAEKSGAFAVGMDTDFVFGPKHNKGFALEFPVSPKTSGDLCGFIKATKLPFIFKGILSEYDAVRALELGAGGIVVSHHGGSVADYALPPLRILPRIAKIAGGKIPIFLDSAVTRGADVFKALALGANAVSVGKELIKGLSADGADGVRTLINDVTEELRWTMNVTGSMDLRSIDPAVIWDKTRS
ncbi:FMN-dependent dehydrogenase [Clostridia bacterium]|nr:FMN-dependent dehydrogenase [Clostridia bacterium]